jgi:hypothetical protein
VIRALSFVLVGLASCSPSPAPACTRSTDCASGSSCIDARCVPSGGDAGAIGRDGGSRDAATGDVVCLEVESEGREVLRPIDAIVLPDESGSMGPARDSVAASMETTFRTAMETAGIDYRVIWNGTTPLPMIEATGRLTRNPIGLGSGDDAMFKPVLDTYETWRPALRDDALKVFVHFTDAQSGTGARIAGYTGTFDQVLVAREPALWGTEGDYRFVYHAFVGLTPNTPPESPYEPADPIVGGTCDGRFANPEALQSMAQRTGGLRFPLCLFDRFDSVFARIAASAIERATVACELELPDPPEGMTIDLETLAVRYTAGAGGETVFTRASSMAECGPDRFMLEGDRVILCAEACDVVEADPTATLTVLTGCDPALY